MLFTARRSFADDVRDITPKMLLFFFCPVDHLHCDYYYDVLSFYMPQKFKKNVQIGIWRTRRPQSS
jgi:hypothetical protein